MAGDRPPSADTPEPRPSANRLRPETMAIKAGRPTEPGQPLNSPIVTASNFHHGGEREYARGDGTQTADAFEAAIGELEGGWAVSFSSGMAAISAIFDLLPRGAIIGVSEECYQGVDMILADGERERGWQVKRVPNGDTQRWLTVIGIGPDLIWVESPSNPVLTVADVPTICAAAEHAGVRCAVDNTVATPLLQRPLDNGAALSVHSVTKFIGGHSDLLGGVVVTADPELRDGLRRRRLLGGATIGALEAFLALRGLRTLPVRLARAQATAATLATKLAAHRAVTAVHYPGLIDDPGHDVAKRSLSGPGALMSFETVGTAVELDECLAKLQIVEAATSLGGVETTIERRARLEGQEHLPPTLTRLSVGCEHGDDLWADLSAVLDLLPQAPAGG